MQNADKYQYDDDCCEVHGALLPSRITGRECSPQSVVRVVGAPGKGGSLSPSSLKPAGYRFSPSLLPTAAAAAVFGLLCGLGFWQLDRAAGKEERQAAFEARRAVVLDEIDLGGEPLEFARVDLEGPLRPVPPVPPGQPYPPGPAGVLRAHPLPDRGPRGGARQPGMGAGRTGSGRPPRCPRSRGRPAPAGNRAPSPRGPVRPRRHRPCGGGMAARGAAGGDRRHAAFARLSPRRVARRPGSGRFTRLRPEWKAAPGLTPGPASGICLSMVLRSRRPCSESGSRST